MSAPPLKPDKQVQTDNNSASARIGRTAERKIRAREHKRLGVWFGLGMFGVIGWAVAVPTVIGVLAGTWLDAHAPAGFSWVLTLLMAGLLTGCVNAWWWLTRSHADPQNSGQEGDD